MAPQSFVLVQLGEPDHLLGESRARTRSPRCAAISADGNKLVGDSSPGRVYGAASSRDSAAYASASSSRPRRSSDEREVPERVGGAPLVPL